MSSSDDDGSYSDWKETKIKVERKGINDSLKPKYSQKFCEKWMKMFTPWLARCEDDPSKPFCRACQCRLDSNRCHLQRHERTTKHARNLEILINKGEVAARQNLSIRQERSKYYQQRKKINSSINSSSQDINISDVAYDTTEHYIEEADGETYFQFVQTDQYNEENALKNDSNLMDEQMQHDDADYKTHGNNVYEQDIEKYVKNNINNANNINNNKISSNNSGIKKERMQLFMQIQKDKNDLMDSFKELMSTALAQSPKEKNHVDLFFDSVSSSVKALTPKLVAEAKMRIMQLICELELRALTENDAIAATNSKAATIVMAPADNHNTTTSYFINTPIRTIVQTTSTPKVINDDEVQQEEYEEIR